MSATSQVQAQADSGFMDLRFGRVDVLKTQPFCQAASTSRARPQPRPLRECRQQASIQSPLLRSDSSCEGICRMHLRDEAVRSRTLSDQLEAHVPL